MTKAGLKSAPWKDAGLDSAPWKAGFKAGFAESSALSPYPEGSEEGDLWHAALMYGRGVATHQRNTVVVCRLLLVSMILNLILAAALLFRR